MICPHCDVDGKHFVDSTRETRNRIIRKRKCKFCEGRFETIELVKKPTDVMSDRMLERLIYEGVIIHD
jgi:transcriptional regulator NrdR family protein